MLAPHSVLRVFLKSAQARRRAPNGSGTRGLPVPPPRSVVRVFLKSAKGAARPTKEARNRIAPGVVYPLRVLRVFLKK